LQTRKDSTADIT